MTARGFFFFLALSGWLAGSPRAQLIDPYFFAKTEAAPFDRAKIKVESETLDTVAADLALLSGNIVIPNRTRGQIAAVGLALDPENSILAALNAALEQGEPPAIQETSRDLDQVARSLVESACQIHQNWQTTGSKDAKILSTMLIDICLAIYPEDPKLIYTRDMFLRKNPPVDWKICLVEVERGGAGAGPAVAARQLPKSGLQLKQPQSGVRALLIRELPGGGHAGKGSRMSATYVADKRGSAEGVRFNQEVGEYMAESLLNLKTFMADRHGNWFEEGYVEFAFQEKFVFKDGDSAGLACALMMESIVTGLELDERFTCTGAINPDGTVGAIGGVVAKLRGAEKDGASLIALPLENQYALNDLVVLGEAESLAQLQVFVVNRFEDAIAIARPDRDPEISASMNDFAKLQRQFSGGVLSVIRTAEARQLLDRILERTPNHASAELMRQVAAGEAPTQLSLNGSMEQLMGEISYAMQIAEVEEAGNRPVVRMSASPPSAKAQLDRAADRLEKLEPVLPRETKAIVTSIREFQKSLRDLNARRNDVNSMAAAASLGGVFRALQKISKHPDLIEELETD